MYIYNKLHVLIIVQEKMRQLTHVFVVYVYFVGLLKTWFNQSYLVSYAHNVSLRGVCRRQS